MATITHQTSSSEREMSDTRLALSPDEEQVLALYDRLQELRLEVAIINAQRTVQLDPNATLSDAQTRQAQVDLLDAKAQYKLRHEVVEAAMTANPILKAVHNSTEASPIERDLLPHVERRDAESSAVALHSVDAMAVRDEISRVQSEVLRASRRNVDLAAELLGLTDEVRRRKGAPVGDPERQGEMERLEGEMRASRARWRVIKGVASGVVAGSGVDWGRDERLRDMVLDPEVED